MFLCVLCCALCALLKTIELAVGRANIVALIVTTTLMRRLLIDIFEQVFGICVF